MQQLQESFGESSEFTTNRFARLGNHPVDRDAAILPTHPMEEFINEIREWLESRITGGIVWGNQRIGKTQAVRYLIANGEQLLGAPIPMGLFSAWDPT